MATTKKITSLYLDDAQRVQIDQRGEMSATIRESLDRYFTLLQLGERELRGMFDDAEMSALDQIAGGTFWQAFSIRYLPEQLREAIADGDCPLDAVQADMLAGKLDILPLHQVFALADILERRRRAGKYSA